MSPDTRCCPRRPDRLYPVVRHPQSNVPFQRNKELWPLQIKIHLNRFFLRSGNNLRFRITKKLGLFQAIILHQVLNTKKILCSWVFVHNLKTITFTPKLLHKNNKTNVSFHSLYFLVCTQTYFWKLSLVSDYWYHGLTTEVNNLCMSGGHTKCDTAKLKFRDIKHTVKLYNLMTTVQQWEKIFCSTKLVMCIV